MGQSQILHKHVRSSLLHLGLWPSPTEGRVHHCPGGTHDHSHRHHRQRGQVLQGDRFWGCGVRGQGCLHRAHHQVLCLRRLLRHPLQHSPVGWGQASSPLSPHLLDSHHCWLQHQVPHCVHWQRLDEP